MLRQFARHSLVYGAATLVVRGLNLLLVPVYTRVLAPADYGLIDLSAVVVAVVGVTVALEISQGLARFVSDPGDAADGRTYASTALGFASATYGLFAILGLAIAAPLQDVVFGRQAPPGLMHVVVVTAACSGFFHLVLNVLRWNLRPLSYVACSLTFALTVAGFSVWLVVVVGLGIFGVILGQLIGTAVATSLGLWLARHFFAPIFDITALRAMLRFSVPLVPSGIGVLITLYVDRAAIRALMTLADVGLFGIGYRIASIAGLVMIGFQVALTPLIYAHYRDERMPDELARIFRTFVGFAVLMVLGLGVFAREIVSIIATPAYHGAAVVVPVLAPALLLSAMYIFAPGLAIARRTGPIAVIHITTALANTTLNLALIPVLGILGAALATLCSAVLAFAAYMVLSQRHYPVPHDWAQLAGAAVVGGACLAGGLMLDPEAAWSLGGRVVLVVIAAGAMVWLRMIRLSDLRALTRSPFAAARRSPDIKPD